MKWNVVAFGFLQTAFTHFSGRKIMEICQFSRTFGVCPHQTIANSLYVYHICTCMRELIHTSA